MKKFLNSRGFSLVEALVASGVLAIASFGAITLSQQQMSSVNEINTKSLEIDLLYNIEKALMNADFCEATFATPGISIGDNFTQIVNPDTDILYETTNLYSDGKIRIDTMSIVNVNIPLGGDPIVYGTAQLNLELSRLNSSNEFEPISKNFQLNLETDDNGVILKCFDTSEFIAEASKDVFCEQDGGVYDEATNTCNLSGACDFTNEANTKQVSSECFMNNYITLEANPNYLRQSFDGTINGHLTANADIAIGALTSERTLVSGTLATAATTSLNISGTLDLNGQVPATTNDLFTSLDETQKETILNGIVTNTVNTNGINALRNHFRSSISVSSCAGTVNGFALNPATGVVTLSCE